MMYRNAVPKKAAKVCVLKKYGQLSEKQPDLYDALFIIPPIGW